MSRFVFKQEVRNMNMLAEALDDFEADYKVKIAVVCFIFDKEGNLILQRRGPGARDEVGKLQAIGGSINKMDVDFRASMLREISEEGGPYAEVRIDGFIGAQSDIKYDKNAAETVNWIVLGYKGTLVNGNLVNGEPDRCIGFEKNKLDGFKREDLSDTAYNFIQELIKEREQQ